MSYSGIRTYTKEFGAHMANLLPIFNNNPAIKLVASSADDLVIESLATLPMGEDSWADAGLPELLKYVYGAKGLKIPQPWKRCFPSDIFA